MIMNAGFAFARDRIDRDLNPGSESWRIPKSEFEILDLKFKIFEIKECSEKKSKFHN